MRIDDVIYFIKIIFLAFLHFDILYSSYFFLMLSYFCVNEMIYLSFLATAKKSVKYLYKIFLYKVSLPIKIMTASDKDNDC